MNAVPLDAHRRPLRSLRISVTDRCNLRCHYCMPEDSYVWLDRTQILTFEEIDRLAGAFVTMGVDRFRLTGGEPLLRQDLPELVRILARHEVRDLALTTNALRLEAHGAALRDAGLHRVTASLDSLDPARYARLTGRDMLHKALAGIAHASELGFRSLKINAVIVRGENDDELVDLVEFGRRHGAEVRFIEYMDVGGATRWRPDRVVGRDEILARLRDHYGDLVPAGKDGAAPADRWRLPDGGCVGVIASTTAPFCASCDRSRLTADGTWYLCLYARTGIDLRGVLRGGVSDGQLRELLASVWRGRIDRGAEERLALSQRGALATRSELGRDPHLEMHTRGG